MNACGSGRKPGASSYTRRIPLSPRAGKWSYMSDTRTRFMVADRAPHCRMSSLTRPCKRHPDGYFFSVIHVGRVILCGPQTRCIREFASEWGVLETLCDSKLPSSPSTGRHRLISVNADRSPNSLFNHTAGPSVDSLFSTNPLPSLAPGSTPSQARPGICWYRRRLAPSCAA